ncbi:MAG: hypothetical protein M3Z46_06825 [Actinomycetota bacterium]|nr:hypothetical protein [Actinomycetota bacterium]
MDDGAAPEKKTPVEHAFDVFVYAPLGLALEARSLMPRLVERGRQQVMMARLIGKFAVRQGQKESTKVLGRAGEQATAALSDLGLLPRDGDPVGRTAAAPKVADGAGDVTATVVSVPAPAPAAPASDAVTPSVDPATHLAIADFDSLAASQVVPRLPGLSSTELEAVRNYEAVHRGRKTVLNRIAQLQSA